MDVSWQEAIDGAVFSVEAYVATVHTIVEAAADGEVGVEVEEHVRLNALADVLGRQLAVLGFVRVGDEVSLRTPGTDGEAELWELLQRVASGMLHSDPPEPDLVHCLASAVSHLLAAYGAPVEAVVRPLMARGANPFWAGSLRLDESDTLTLELSGP